MKTYIINKCGYFFISEVSVNIGVLKAMGCKIFDTYEAMLNSIVESRALEEDEILGNEILICKNEFGAIVDDVHNGMNEEGNEIYTNLEKYISDFIL